MSKTIIEVQVPSDQLELGMHVVRLDRPWLESSFLLQGFIIQSANDLEALRNECEHVFIEASSYEQNKKPLHQNIGTPHPSDINGITPPTQKEEPWRKKLGKAKYINKISFEQEFDNAREQFTDTRSYAKNIMDGLRLGQSLDVAEARKIVEQCVDSVLNNNDALLWLTHIKNRDEYTAEHSMNVCVLSANFARHLGLIESEVVKVALCGLLHDVGKTKVPLEILNKPDALTPEEFKIMRAHTVYGRDILMSAANKDRITVDVALSHHERENGTGYPRKLDSGRIPFYAKIITLTDTYDAITSNRCYDEGRTSMQALKIINENKGQLFDDELASEFINCVGVYPPGTIVEMSNGQIGIVINSQPKNRLRPKVLILTDEEKHKYETPKYVDLLLMQLDPQGKPYRIALELKNGSFGICLSDYIDLTHLATAELTA